MKRFRVSATAREDLDEIWFYIAQDDVVVADKFIQTVVSKFSTLAEWPELGRGREELSPKVRSLVVGNHVIFYRRMENGIEIVRVLHGARDLPPMFE